MRYTTDYMVGNTAVQISMTGKKVKVIDVEAHQRRREIIRNVVLVAVLSALLFSTCYSIVKTSSKSVLISHQITSLNTEIEQLEKEKADMHNQQIEAIDYDVVLKEAREHFGMVFPKNEQIYSY